MSGLIQGGYYLKAKKIEKSAINIAPPYMREIWDFLLREAKFKDTKVGSFVVKEGQLFTSYTKITSKLKWYVGNRSYKYTTDQVKKALIFFRNHKMVVTQKKAKGVVITVCNYRYYQNWKNYGSLLRSPEYSNENSNLQGNKTTESLLQREEIMTERHPQISESLLQKPAKQAVTTIPGDHDGSESLLPREAESLLRADEYSNENSNLQGNKTTESLLREAESLLQREEIMTERHPQISESLLQKPAKQAVTTIPGDHDGSESLLPREAESLLRADEYSNENSNLQGNKTTESLLREAESLLPAAKCSNKNSDLQEKKLSTAPSIKNNTSILESMSMRYNIRALPEPESWEEIFDRDRRVFFESFPGLKTFQLFDDNPDRGDKSLIKQFHITGTLPHNYTHRLEVLNDQGAGVYLCINETNGKSRKATDIVKVRSVYSDLDGCPVDPIWECEPSMVVESSPGKFHAFWLTKDVPLDGFRQVQEGIIHRFGSDPKVKDLPRVMRVPGFNHMKSEPFLSRIIHYTGQYFAFDYLTDMFPPPPRKKWSAQKYSDPVRSDPNAEFKGQYGAEAGGRNNHIVARIGGCIKRGVSWPQIEEEAFKEAAACIPPLGEAEVKAALRSMGRYA